MKNANGYGGIRKLSGKRRRPYQVVVTGGWDIVNGKARQKQVTIGYCSTQKEAQMLLAEYNGAPFDLEKTNLTFLESFNQLTWKSERMEKSAKIIFKRCEPIYDMPVRDIKTRHLQQILDTLSGMSASTQDLLVMVMKRTLDYAVKNDVTTKNYADFLVKPPHSEPKMWHAFTIEEIELLRRFPPAFVSCLTGIRAAELCALTAEDILPPSIGCPCGIINIRKSKTKSGIRKIPIHPIIKDYVVGVAEKNINRGSYVNNFSSYVRGCGIEAHHTSHDCRRTFATLCKTHGVNDLARKRIIGHVSGDITDDVYTDTDMAWLYSEIIKITL